MLKHLFEEEWNTSLELTADENGYIDFRGFFGNYTVSGAQGCAAFSLEKGKGNTESLTLH